MQLFKRFTENSVMELYWCSYLCNANGGCKAVSGKAPSLRSFGYTDSVQFVAEMNIVKYGKMKKKKNSWPTWFKNYIRTSLSHQLGRLHTLVVETKKAYLKPRLFTLAQGWWEQYNAPTRPLRSVVAVWRLHVARQQEDFLLSGWNTRESLSHLQTLTRLSS